MDTLRISVIMPVYNGERTIRESIESALNQTFTDFELIVIDDGSQDATLDILADIQDTRLKIFSYSNAGISASRNRGIAHARGEFVTFLDADDLWTPDKLETQLKALEANPQAILAYSWTEFIDETGRPVGTFLRSTASGNVLAELLESNFIGSGSNALINKQAIVELGEFDQSFSPAGDWDMWLRLAAHYQFAVVPSTQVLYRITESAATNNLLRMETSSLAVIERAFDHAPESLQYIKRRSIANLYEYLTSRATYGSLNRQKSLIAAKFLFLTLRYNPALLQRPHFIVSRAFKIMVAILLPGQLAAILLTKIRAMIRQPNGFLLNQENNV